VHFDQWPRRRRTKPWNVIKWLYLLVVRDVFQRCYGENKQCIEWHSNDEGLGRVRSHRSTGETRLIDRLQVISRTARGRLTLLRRHRTAVSRWPRRRGRRPSTCPSTRPGSALRRSDSIRQRRRRPAVHSSSRRRTRHDLLHSSLLSGSVLV